MTRRSDRLALVTLAGLALVWGIFALDPAAWAGLSGALVQSGLLPANVALTRRAPRVKARLVAALQRRVVNPLVRGLYRLGVNPLGIALLETTGRRSGRVRQVPVGDGRDGEVFWVVAERGMRAGYVRNLQADPRVRVHVREAGGAAGGTASRPCCRTTIPLRGNGSSSVATRCAPSTPRACACSARNRSRSGSTCCPRTLRQFAIRPGGPTTAQRWRPARAPLSRWSRAPRREGDGADAGPMPTRCPPPRARPAPRARW